MINLTFAELGIGGDPEFWGNWVKRMHHLQEYRGAYAELRKANPFAARTGTATMVASGLSEIRLSPVLIMNRSVSSWRCCHRTCRRLSRTVFTDRQQPSDAAKAKKAIKRSPRRIASWASPIWADRLGLLTRNAMRLSLRGTHSFTLYTTPTRLQEAAFRLLQLKSLRVL